MCHVSFLFLLFSTIVVTIDLNICIVFFLSRAIFYKIHSVLSSKNAVISSWLCWPWLEALKYSDAWVMLVFSYFVNIIHWYYISLSQMWQQKPGKWRGKHQKRINHKSSIFLVPFVKPCRCFDRYQRVDALHLALRCKGFSFFFLYSESHFKERRERIRGHCISLGCKQKRKL